MVEIGDVVAFVISRGEPVSVMEKLFWSFGDVLSIVMSLIHYSQKMVRLSWSYILVSMKISAIYLWTVLALKGVEGFVFNSLARSMEIKSSFCQIQFL